MINLPISGESIKKESFAPVDIGAINNRIQTLIKVLNNFKDLRETGKSRQEYVYFIDIILYLFFLLLLFYFNFI